MPRVGDVIRPIPKKRSPNYPGLSLETAITRLSGLFEKINRHTVGVEVACQSMGVSHKSSTGLVLLGALRAYGLLDDVKSGIETMVKISDLGLDIVADSRPGSVAWLGFVRKAAKLPKIHGELWNKYGASLPPDDELRRFLIREKDFGDKAATVCIVRYKKTIAFAKLAEGGAIANNTATENEESEAGPEAGEEVHEEWLDRVPGPGNYVQWSRQGKDQFACPQKIIRVSPDWQFAFVEGSSKPLPMSELTVQDPPTKARAVGQARASLSGDVIANGPYISFPLPGGNLIEIRLRSKVSKKDFDRIKALLDLSEGSLVDEDEPESRENLPPGIRGVE